ncbi:hypothetical protein JTE90_019455 [Oedothorax gibbosus]|uniref:LanC-like protein 2 n=1 Tax=Oedothorax gibbosus TaxID=931172 RepID=A0AAV6UXW5_9ARAC|nr:hypothetical protein JTE90_019455 [Oedothorax gibbosus]
MSEKAAGGGGGVKETREFENPYVDWNSRMEIYMEDEKRLIPGITGPLIENCYILLETLEKHLATDVDWQDTTVYTGAAGIALLYMRFLDSELEPGDPKGDFLQDALNYVEPILPSLCKRRISFLCGASGPLAIAATLYYRKGDHKEAEDLLRRLENLENDATASQSYYPDEILYGRAGYLYSLLYIKRKIPEKSEHREKCIREVVKKILESGQRNAKKKKNINKIPLFYEWHNKAYVGAGHGFAGIMYMLLEAKEYMSADQLNSLVRPTVDFVLRQHQKSGNFPSSLGNPRDRLVHWCHGAPGLIYMLLKAHEVFQDEKYLVGARKAADCVWKRGLLRKGYGICHGVSGNAYSFLKMYQHTKELRYLYRAVKFAEWCFDYGKHGCRSPDRSLSLFEGFAGIIYFLLDLLEPEKVAFPGFQL